MPSVSSSAPSSEPAAPPAFLPRQRDRRTALGDVLCALTRVLGDRYDVSLMRGLFEETVRRALPIRTIQLRDRNSRWTSRPGPNAGIESIALEVPGSPAGGVLEATFDPGCGLGAWDVQPLGLAAHGAAFILAIERARAEPADTQSVVMNETNRDGPAVSPRKERNGSREVGFSREVLVKRSSERLERATSAFSAARGTRCLVRVVEQREMARPPRHRARARADGRAFWVQALPRAEIVG